MMPRELLTIAPSPRASNPEFDVLGRTALSPIAGNEDPGTRHSGAHLFELFGIGRPDNRSDIAVP